ncbi:MAG: Putative 2-acylglycerophosphoethanolamine acyltransferase / acyl-acyl carrier protein synthetase (EC [uncultured Thiotrichaceae bacterium]|uniref:2-acylglycerophosphoethanolamine acyltransferase / acyl-acyl carrier protein synthetase (EC) n=1 Tax=uncultured Thiotrichaceae bacterium TaxID=298394 RepID=A0A6S6UFT4_9GAMM|nr:MAG: Putative 2-acylglycerophosphoethanolamine acyltransferase / acyl-acyl carrier protein synthetase (EC [uncultured Thiotrichaceae bacterium]
MQNSIYKITGFITFLTVLFLNAFVDLGHKIIIQNTVFKTYDGGQQIALTALVNALILLPFILLFTPSGYLSDKHPKNHIMRISAFAAVLITLLITLSYYQGWFWISFGLTFLLAIQSALYSPAKYGFIRELVGEKHLAEGNGIVQATTMVAILGGTFFFSIFFQQLLPENIENNPTEILHHIAPLGWALVAFSMLELFFAFKVPQKTSTDTSMNFQWNDYVSGRTQRKNLSLVKKNQFIWLSIVGLSVFWAVAQVVIATYPAYAKEHLDITRVDLLQGILACTGIGIMIGAYTAGKISRNHIESGLVPVGAIGLAIAISLITYFDSLVLQAVNFIFLGIMGGFFVVPLNAYMQFHAEKNQLGRVLAAYNFIHHGVMLVFLVITAYLAHNNLDGVYFFYAMTAIVVAGAIYTIYQLPQSLLRFIVSRLFSARYSINVEGFQNIPSSGGALLLGNHISWVDWALVQIATPRTLHFVMERGYYERWYLNWFLKMFGVVPISARSSASSLKVITDLLNDGKAVCLFPEGTISRTGQLSEFKKGYEKAIEDTDAVIIPFYLHGLWGSRWSRSSGFLKENRQSGFKRDIIVAFGEPLPANTKADTLKRRVFDLSVTSWHDYAEKLPPIPVQWLQAAKRMGFRMASTDVTGEPLSNHKFITAVFRFAKLIKKNSPEQNIGLMVPTSTGGAIANMAVMTLGKTIVNLNFTASETALRAAVKKANISTIYTSTKFLKKLEQRGIHVKEIFPDTRLLYLEDLKTQISKANMLGTLLMVMILPTRILRTLFLSSVKPNYTAAILFSSGSEGEPKGIELSHINLSANARQVADTLNTRENDVIMSTLPTFHAFGLLASTLMPLSEGIPIVCHPDPTDVVNIAKGASKFQGTVMFGTSTFLRLYVRNNRVHPLMLKSLRLVIAGAEKLNPDIREAFNLKFKKDVLEGFGATETSPVASVNVPDELDSTFWKTQVGNKVGTVGMPLPGTSFRIVDPTIMEELATGEDGLILIAGPQVMKGYLSDPSKTAEVISEFNQQRWYKTGDKGHLDKDGFLTIVDRYSRFAKLGGEMVSLTGVEEEIRIAMQNPELELVAVNTPDTKKGEKITILIADETPEKHIKQILIDAKMNPLMIPSEFIQVDEIPKLGSGKTDFNTSRKLVLGSI